MLASIVSSAVLLPWSDATSRVCTKAFLVVIIMTPVSALLVIDWIRYCCDI
jgi:hypothetical protein